MRELANVLERSAILVEGNQIDADDLALRQPIGTTPGRRTRNHPKRAYEDLFPIPPRKGQVFANVSSRTEGASDRNLCNIHWADS